MITMTTCWRIWLVKTFRTLLSHIDHKQVKIICTYMRIWLVKTFRTLLSHIDHKQVKIICTYMRLWAGDSTVKGKTTLNIPIYCLICWRVLISVDPSIVLLSKLTTLITTISSYSISTWVCSYKIIIKFCIPTLGYGPRAYCALKQWNKLLEIFYYTTCYKCRLTWN